MTRDDPITIEEKEAALVRLKGQRIDGRTIEAEVYAARRKVVPITVPDDLAVEDEAVAKLKQLQQQAFAVRNAMDFCVKYISVERLIMENLPLEATIAHAARHQCTMMDAREYVARRMAEGVDSEPKTSGVDP
jgi:hypothetical protein